MENFESLRIGSFRLRRFWAVRSKRNASWDSLAGSSSQLSAPTVPFMDDVDFFGVRRLKWYGKDKIVVGKRN